MAFLFKIIDINIKEKKIMTKNHVLGALFSKPDVRDFTARATKSEFVD
jgi:hypothetical protein